MTRYIFRRLVHSIFIIWGVATLVFFGLRAIPGDPVVQLLGEEYTPEAAANIEKSLDSTSLSTFNTLSGWGTDTGDLGHSIASSETVTDAIKTGLPKTLALQSSRLLLRLSLRYLREYFPLFVATPGWTMGLV